MALILIYYPSISFNFSFPQNRVPDQVLMQSVRVTDTVLLWSLVRRKPFVSNHILHATEGKIEKKTCLACLRSNCSEDNLKYWDIDSLNIAGLLICGHSKSPIIGDLLAGDVSLIFSNIVHSISPSQEAAGRTALPRHLHYYDLWAVSMGLSLHRHRASLDSGESSWALRYMQKQKFLLDWKIMIPAPLNCF